MSWDSHIQPMMAAQKGTGHCAICGQDGGIWASSPSCPLQPQEIKDLVAFAKSGGQPSDKRYFFGGMKLMFVKQDTTDNVAQFIFAPQSTAERKVTDEEKGLVCVIITKTAAVITYVSGTNQRAAVTSCLNEAKYLNECNM